MPLKVKGQVEAVLTKPAGARGFPMRNAVLGSWARTGLVAAIFVLILGSIAVLGATGRLGDLRYLNIPLVHPWPPAGYYQNPFNPTDHGDLVSSAEAAKVKADLVTDGQIELQATRTGDGSHLTEADTGNNLMRLRSVLGYRQQPDAAPICPCQKRRRWRYRGLHQPDHQGYGRQACRSKRSERHVVCGGNRDVADYLFANLRRLCRSDTANPIR